MTENSVAGTFVLGGVVGFALFFIVTGLGGRGSVGRGEVIPPPRPPPPISLPKDDKRLSFVMIEPRESGHSMGFRLRDGDPSKIYALKELIARVKDGGRSDVELRANGDVMHGPWDEARASVKRAGLMVWETPVHAGSWHAGSWQAGSRTAINTRGQYRRGPW